MGQAVSEIKGALDTEKDLDLAKEVLEQMEGRAQDAIEMFKMKLQIQPLTDKKIPIKTVIDEREFIKVQTKTVEQLGDSISKCVDSFCNGNVKEGIVGLATTAIAGVLGGNKGSSQRDQKYSISVNRLGAVQRLDAFFWSYSVESPGLITHAQSILACYVVISTVDLLKLDANELGVITEMSFLNLPDDKLKQTYNYIKGAFEENQKDIVKQKRLLAARGD